MLFIARRNEEGNVHRSHGVSKTVIKNMWFGFFKNQKIKERPKNFPLGGKPNKAGQKFSLGVRIRFFDN
jgi:hypothetical protein